MENIHLFLDERKILFSILIYSQSLSLFSFGLILSAGRKFASTGKFWKYNQTTAGLIASITQTVKVFWFL